MAQRPTLSDMLAPKPGATQPGPDQHDGAGVAPDPTPAEPQAVKRKRGRPPKPRVLRDDALKGQTLRLTPAAWRQLKLMAIDEGKPAHDLLLEAVNDLFTKYGKIPIA